MKSLIQRIVQPCREGGEKSSNQVTDQGYGFRDGCWTNLCDPPTQLFLPFCLKPPKHRELNFGLVKINLEGKGPVKWVGRDVCVLANMEKGDFKDLCQKELLFINVSNEITR